MKRRIFGWSTLAVLCASSGAFADDGPRVFQTAEVQPAGSSAEGAAWLKRSENRVDGRVMAKVDKANTPYSIWWVVFNNPDGCTVPCGMDDVPNPDANVAIFNASGAISAASGALKRNGKPAEGGVINVDLSVIAGEGALNGSQVPFCPFPFCENVLKEDNGLCAEIHVDINEHDFEEGSNWVDELTYPENPQAFAVFPAVGECSDHDDD